MAHYDIAHTCGHVERVELFGKLAERDYKINRLRQQACPACLAKKINEAGAFCGLRQLHGSDRQIIWANDLRKQFMTNFREIQETAESKNAPDLMRIISAYYNAILAQDSREWIDNRDNYSCTRAILLDMNVFAKKMQLL